MAAAPRCVVRWHPVVVDRVYLVVVCALYVVDFLFPEASLYCMYIYLEFAVMNKAYFVGIHACLVLFDPLLSLHLHRALG